MNNYSEKKKEKKKNLKKSANQKRFFIKKLMEKSELPVQIAKVSGKKTETTDQKVHNFLLTKIGGKGRQE